MASTVVARRLLPLLLALLVGCAPRVVLERPANWPAEWRQRALFNTPGAFIYARNPQFAGEADRWLQSVRRQFERDAGVPPTKGILLVSDVGAPPLVDDADRLFDMLSRAEQESADAVARADARAAHESQTSAPASAPSSAPTAQPDDDNSVTTTRRQLEELGLDAAWLQTCTAFPIYDADLRETLAFAAPVDGAAAWTVSVPTADACRQAAERMLDGIFKKAEVGIGERILLAPWMPLMRGMAADELIAERDAALYEQFVHAAPQLSAERKHELLAQMRARHNAASQERVSKRERHARAQTPPPASQPD